MDLKYIRIKPTWTKSKEDTWAELFEQLDEHSITRYYEPDRVKQSGLSGISPDSFAANKDVAKQVELYPKSEQKYLTRRISLWSCAAGLLIPIILVCCFYTKTINTTRGEQTVVQLPDQSTITLNAESKLSYKPFVWMIARVKNAPAGLSSSLINGRKVRFEGEAFFDVTTGSRFSVQTGDYWVNVLGTTFNVYARPDMYRVNCLSGQVEVLTGQENVVLQPNMQATLRERQLMVNSDVTPLTANGWMHGLFVFEGTPLREVVAEIERQYNIRVTFDYNQSHLYTGKFSKTGTPDEILEVIGKAFGITFSQE